jgi:hypothetical protein
VAIYFGAWEYSKKFFLIPIWLPLLWGIGALIVENMSETLLETVPKKSELNEKKGQTCYFLINLIRGQINQLFKAQCFWQIKESFKTIRDSVFN